MKDRFQHGRRRARPPGEHLFGASQTIDPTALPGVSRHSPYVRALT
jgi:hypothetical protein